MTSRHRAGLALTGPEDVAGLPAPVRAPRKPPAQPLSGASDPAMHDALLHAPITLPAPVEVLPLPTEALPSPPPAAAKAERRRRGKVAAPETPPPPSAAIARAGVVLIEGLDVDIHIPWPLMRNGECTPVVCDCGEPFVSSQGQHTGKRSRYHLHCRACGQAGSVDAELWQRVMQQWEKLQPIALVS